ncbi:MAG: hypothetical protein AB7Q16_05905 [Vicinamibacterales bacterium]
MRGRFSLILLFVLAALLPREASAQVDPITNVGACPASTGYDAAATSIVVATGCGADLPTAATNYSWCNVTDYPVNCKDTSGTRDPNYEIVRCTRSSDTLTCTRDAEGSYGASTKNTAGKSYWLSTLTAKTFTDISTGLAASSLTLGTNATLTNERVFTPGTSLSATDNGAGSTYDLNTIQDIRTTATPQFAGGTLGPSTSSLGVSGTKLAIVGTDATTSVFTHEAFGSNGIYEVRRANNTKASPQRLHSGDQIFRFRGGGSYDTTDTPGTATSVQNKVAISFDAFGDWDASTNTPTRISFATVAPSSGTISNRMTLETTNGLQLLSLPLTHSGFNFNIKSEGAIELFPDTTNSTYGGLRITLGNNPLEPGGGTDQHQTIAHLTAEADSVTHYFNPSYDFRVADASGNLASAWGNLVEGNWTNAGGFTLNRWALWDYGAQKTVMFVQSGSSVSGVEARSLNIGSTGTDEGYLINQVGYNVVDDTLPDNGTAGWTFANPWTANTATTRTWNLATLYPTFNFGGSNAGKTINLLNIGSANTSLTGATVIPIQVSFGATQLFRLTSSAVAALGGTATRSSADGTNTFRCFNGTPPSGTLTNGADWFCASGEVYAMNSSGASRKLTGWTQSKSFSIENPGAAENFGGIRFNEAVTITKVVAVLQGSSTPSITWSVRHGTDRSATGAECVSGGTATTSVSTGSVVSSCTSDGTLAADEFLWLVTTAQSGTVTGLHVTVFYTVD